jgi:hypothetical protein
MLGVLKALTIVDAWTRRAERTMCFLVCSNEHTLIRIMSVKLAVDEYTKSHLVSLFL